jgi:ubiquinone/menaquinone biosynthesis C-methylase UbiE
MVFSVGQSSVASGRHPTILAFHYLHKDIFMSMSSGNLAHSVGNSPTMIARIAFDDLNATLKATGEETRLRILCLLAEAELTVSELTDILRQSQPRISRHLKLLTEARLIERFREGSWAFFRRAEHGPAAAVAGYLVGALDPNDPIVARDRERLAGVRAARVKAAQDYFRRHAAEWDRIRQLHAADDAVEAEIRTLLRDRPFRSLLDLGTGTGRILEIFSSEIERGLGVDLSREMLAVARSRLDHAGIRNCSVRQGDIFDLSVPRDSFDVVIIHQVLHFLDDGGRAIREAARVLRPEGRILVVDFAPHELEFLREEYAHRRLGFAPEAVTQWMEQAGLEGVVHKSLAPEPGSDGRIAVSLWLAHDPRLALAGGREVA